MCGRMMSQTMCVWVSAFVAPLQARADRPHVRLVLALIPFWIVNGCVL
jgi:hypothetical protein